MGSDKRDKLARSSKSEGVRTCTNRVGPHNTRGRAKKSYLESDDVRAIRQRVGKKGVLKSLNVDQHGQLRHRSNV